MDSRFSEWKKLFLSHQAELFTYINVIASFLELMAFGLHKTYSWFGVVLLSRFFMSWFLVWAKKIKHAGVCKIWCLFEAFMMVLILTLGLHRTIKFTNLLMLVAISSSVVKVYGLCVIYYYALEVDSHRDSSSHENVLTFAKQSSQSMDTIMTVENNGNVQSVNATEEFQRPTEFSDNFPVNVEDDDKGGKVALLARPDVQYSVIYM